MIRFFILFFKNLLVTVIIDFAW